MRVLANRIGHGLAGAAQLMVRPETAPSATLLLRLMAGSVFLWEGILKFVFVNQGVGRFTKLGMPVPVLTAHFVGGLEIVGGVLLLIGLATRLIAVPFIIEMVVAILSTKISLFLGHSPLPLPPAPPTSGIWAVLHEVRSEWAQLLVCVFLFRVGPGLVSVDALLAKTVFRRSRARGPVRIESEGVAGSPSSVLCAGDDGATDSARAAYAGKGRAVGSASAGRGQGGAGVARIASERLLELRPA